MRNIVSPRIIAYHLLRLLTNMSDKCASVLHMCIVMLETGLVCSGHVGNANSLAINFILISVQLFLYQLLPLPPRLMCVVFIQLSSLVLSPLQPEQGSAALWLIEWLGLLGINLNA